MKTELETFYDLIDDIKVAMMTTRRPDGHLESRAMANQKRADGADLWFVTAEGSGKLRDIAHDPHYRARDMILKQQTRDGHEIEVPGVVPKLLGTPGTVRSSAPKLGDDTDAVLAELGYAAADIAALRDKKVVA